MWIIVLMLAELAQPVTVETDSPISVSLRGDTGFATIVNRLHPDNRIGYRFHEHVPIVSGDVPAPDGAADAQQKTAEEAESAFRNRPGVVTWPKSISEEGWAPQRWTFYLAPVEDGVDLLLVVETFDAGLNRYYGVQQCFRMSGKTNAAWRREIAETPAFSEYDLWDTEKDAASKTSLTHVMRGGHWQLLPAARETVGARTPLGLAVDTERSGGKIESMPEVGPYRAKMLDPVDSGLISRVDKDQTWVCGLYWQGTSHVSDHHPADCLHAIVNIGGIRPHSKRALRGKIYWFKGSLEDLTRHWNGDFPGEPAG